MRTTLTLEPEIMWKLKDIAHQERKSFKQVVNETLEKGFAAREKPSHDSRFTVAARHCGFKPGVDIGKLNQLIDDLEVDRFNDSSGH